MAKNKGLSMSNFGNDMEQQECALLAYKSVCTWHNYFEKLKFQLWSLGGFTPEAISLLTSAADRTRKYEIEFFDKGQILDMAKAHKVQPVVEVLQQHFQAPLEKTIKKHLK